MYKNNRSILGLTKGRCGFTLSDPKFEPFLKICERYDIPVAVHTGGGPIDLTYKCCPNFRIKLGDPYTIEDVLAKFPKLRIYMMQAKFFMKMH
jgi:Predicted metal-dependent hydrolase of the TIM-barrel fold